MADFDQAIVDRFKSTEEELVSNRLRPLLEAVYQHLQADGFMLNW